MRIWRFLGECLSVPPSKLDVIRDGYSTDEERKKAVVEYLVVDPFPLWRRIIMTLDGMEKYKTADKIRHYAAPLTCR